MVPDHCPPAQDVRVLNGGLQLPESRNGLGYVDKLATTSFGYPSLPHWCVWIEPNPKGSVAGHRWLKRWANAVDAAFNSWSEVIPLTRVAEIERAHVMVFRKRPPLRQLPSGWRASNGRSLLTIIEARRKKATQLEPKVKVMVSPELRAPVLQSTALHELGHAFGLWGHSDHAGDVMAVSQGALPVLTVSKRDRLTLEWIRSQSTNFGQPR